MLIGWSGFSEFLIDWNLNVFVDPKYFSEFIYVFGVYEASVSDNAAFYKSKLQHNIKKMFSSVKEFFSYYRKSFVVGRHI